MPIISVIIPIFNTQDYLKKCLNSVINQTLKDIEIICINDNSTDNSLSILNQYKKQDKRIKIISLNKNKGSSYTRNMGINLSKGEYISFIDSDDYIDSSFYHSLYTKAKTSGAEVIKGGLIKMYGVFDRTGEKSQLNEGIKQNKFNFLREFYSAIYRKDFLKENSLFFDENILTFEDPVFSLDVILKNKTLEMVDDVYYHYLLRRDGKSKLNTAKMAESFILGAEIFIKKLNTANIKKAEYIEIVDDLIISSFYKRCTSKNITNEEFDCLFDKFQTILFQNLLYKEKIQSLKRKRTCTVKYFNEIQKHSVFCELRKRTLQKNA